MLEFVTKPFTRMINDLTAKLLISKNNQVDFIKQEINSIEIDHILQNPKLKEKIAILKNQFSIDICGDHPNAFWNRKKHVVSLPYEEGFSEDNIPTKARPCQMNADYLVI